VNVSSGADRAGKVRDDADLVRVAHRHDFQHFRNPADVGQRGTREVDVAIFDERVEFPALTPLLPRRERHARQQSQLRCFRRQRSDLRNHCFGERGSRPRKRGRRFRLPLAPTRGRPKDGRHFQSRRRSRIS
jgi:hypothetical protein